MDPVAAGPTVLASFSGNVPLARTRLIGRDAELGRARELLLEHSTPVLTLTGPGGSGKTRLAQGLAAALASQPAHDIVWVDLAPLADSVPVTSTVATALGLTPVPGLEIAVQVVATLQSRPFMLILDNCEHVLEAVASHVASWLA